MNRLYQEIMRARVRAALTAASAIAGLEHSGVKGSIREVLVADLFRPILPSDIGIGSGVLISADDQQSSQQDIILFDRRILPPLLFQEGPAIIPVESALVTLEVKSCLTSTELRKAHDGAVSVRELSMRSARSNRAGNWIDVRASAVSSFVLALTSDLTSGGKTEQQRYEDLLNGEHPALSGIIVCGRGSWWQTDRLLYDRVRKSYLRADGNAVENITWGVVPADDNHAEVIHLIAQLLNLMQKISTSRGQPPLSSYLR